MKISVRLTKGFSRQAKPLLKKYHSLASELAQLENDLQVNPKLGSPLGQNSFKIRLSVKSKGKGKSGGLRVISHLENEIISTIEILDDEIIIYLLAIYDKSDTATITENELRNLIKGLKIE